jgi:hypothetical protein
MATSPKQQTDQFIETASRAELQRILRVLVDRSIEAAVLAYQQIPAPGTYDTEPGIEPHPWQSEAGSAYLCAVCPYPRQDTRRHPVGE